MVPFEDLKINSKNQNKKEVKNYKEKEGGWNE